MDFTNALHQINMQKLLILLFLLLGIFFVQAKLNIKKDNDVPNYKEVLEKISELKKVSKQKTIKQAGEMYAQYVAEVMIPYWIGTAWDFNGVSQNPGQGKIACGYLVTTVLQQSGYNLSRIKLAQCASETMINELTHLKENYSKLTMPEIENKIKAKGYGLSVIGLDNHTGFVFYNGKEIYFIHSSYVGTGKVVKEKFSTNAIILYSKYKVIGYLSQNPKFIQKWLAH